MRQVAARVGIRESERLPILVGLAAIAVLVDCLLLVCWLARYAQTPPIFFGAVGPALFQRYFFVRPSVSLLPVVVLSGAALATGCAMRSAFFRARLDTTQARVLLFAGALLAAGLVALGFQAGRPVRLTEGAVAQAQARASAGDDGMLLSLLIHGLPEAVEGARSRLQDPDPTFRFLYGAALEATTGPDEAAREAMVRAMRDLIEEQGFPAPESRAFLRLCIGVDLLRLGPPDPGLPVLTFIKEGPDDLIRAWGEWSTRLR